MSRSHGGSGIPTVPVLNDAAHARRWWTLGVLCFTLVVIAPPAITPTVTSPDRRNHQIPTAA